MNTYNITIENDKKNLFDGLDSSSVQLIDYDSIGNDTSVIVKASVLIPRLAEDEAIGRKSSRKEICAWLQERLDDGSLVLRRTLSPKEQSAKINSREVSQTLLSNLLVKGSRKNNRTFRTISELIRYGRLNDTLSISVKKDYCSVYNVRKAAERGEIMHFVFNGANFYID